MIPSTFPIHLVPEPALSWAVPAVPLADLVPPPALIVPSRLPRPRRLGPQQWGCSCSVLLRGDPRCPRVHPPVEPTLRVLWERVRATCLPWAALVCTPCRPGCVREGALVVAWPDGRSLVSVATCTADNSTTAMVAQACIPAWAAHDPQARSAAWAITAMPNAGPTYAPTHRNACRNLLDAVEHMYDPERSLERWVARMDPRNLGLRWLTWRLLTSQAPSLPPMLTRYRLPSGRAPRLLADLESAVDEVGRLRAMRTARSIICDPLLRRPRERQVLVLDRFGIQVYRELSSNPSQRGYVALWEPRGRGDGPTLRAALHALRLKSPRRHYVLPPQFGGAYLFWQRPPSTFLGGMWVVHLPRRIVGWPVHRSAAAGPDQRPTRREMRDAARQQYPVHCRPRRMARADDGALLGARYWLWRSHERRLCSPHRHTPWHGPVLVAESFSPSSQTANEAGIHAYWPTRTQDAPPLPRTLLDELRPPTTAAAAVVGLVRGYGRYVAGDTAWRAERAIIDHLWVPLPLLEAVRGAYPEVTVSPASELPE